MFIPELINVINRSNFPVMALFCIISGLELTVSFFLEETQGRSPPEKVKEIADKDWNKTQDSDVPNLEIQLVEEKDTM